MTHPTDSLTIIGYLNQGQEGVKDHSLTWAPKLFCNTEALVRLTDVKVLVDKLTEEIGAQKPPSSEVAGGPDLGLSRRG